MNKKLSEHFRQSEFACSCGCGLDDPHPALVNALEKLHDRSRAFYSSRRVQIIISGPLRCRNKNARTPGAVSNSRHLPRYRDGVDIMVYLNHFALPPQILADHVSQIEAFKNGGIGIYNNRCHADVVAHIFNGLWNDPGSNRHGYQDTICKGKFTQPKEASVINELGSS